MTQTERRRFFLSRLLAEAPEYRQLAVPDDAAGQKQLAVPDDAAGQKQLAVPDDAAGQKQLLRALLNVFKDLDKEIYTRLLTA